VRRSPRCGLSTSARTSAPDRVQPGVRTGSGEIVVLLNNDVDAWPDFLDRLVAPLVDDERLGSVAALLLKPGGERIDSFGLTADATLAGYARLRDLPIRAAQAIDPVLIGRRLACRCKRPDCLGRDRRARRRRFDLRRGRWRSRCGFVQPLGRRQVLRTQIATHVGSVTVARVPRVSGTKEGSRGGASELPPL
jgi:hypothetical protein